MNNKIMEKIKRRTILKLRAKIENWQLFSRNNETFYFLQEIVDAIFNFYSKYIESIICIKNIPLYLKSKNLVLPAFFRLSFFK